MDIAKYLIIFILLSCIYNILKIHNFKNRPNYNNKSSSSSYSNFKTSFVRGYYRRSKSGKLTYVRPHSRKHR